MGDEIEIVGYKETQKTTCTGVEMFHKLLDSGEAGDNVGLLLRGTAAQLTRTLVTTPAPHVRWLSPRWLTYAGYHPGASASVRHVRAARTRLSRAGRTRGAGAGQLAPGAPYAPYAPHGTCAYAYAPRAYRSERVRWVSPQALSARTCSLALPLPLTLTLPLALTLALTLNLTLSRPQA